MIKAQLKVQEPFLKCGYHISDLRHRKNTGWRFYAHKLFCGRSTSLTPTLLDSVFFYWEFRNLLMLCWKLWPPRRRGHRRKPGIRQSRQALKVLQVGLAVVWVWPVRTSMQRSPSTGHVSRGNLQSPANKNNFRNVTGQHLWEKRRWSIFWLLISSYSKLKSMHSGCRTTKKMGFSLQYSIPTSLQSLTPQIKKGKNTLILAFRHLESITRRFQDKTRFSRLHWLLCSKSWKPK